MHAHAARLARAPRDELAALFYALSRPFDVIAEDYTILPVVLVKRQAERLGYRLNASTHELVTLKREVCAGLHSYEAVRQWFEERLL